MFQRTANFSLPARNGPMEPERERRHKADYPERRAAAMDTPFAIGGHPKPTQSALEATPTRSATATYEAKWQEGGSISYLYAYTDLLVNKEANDTASEFVRNKIRCDGEGQAAPASCWRPRTIRSAPSGSASIPTITRPTIATNVTLVDVRMRPDPGDHRDGRAHRGGRLRARRHRLRHRLRRHDRRAARDRHPHR